MSNHQMHTMQPTVSLKSMRKSISENASIPSSRGSNQGGGGLLRARSCGPSKYQTFMGSTGQSASSTSMSASPLTRRHAADNKAFFPSQNNNTSHSYWQSAAFSSSPPPPPMNMSYHQQAQQDRFHQSAPSGFFAQGSSALHDSYSSDSDDAASQSPPASPPAKSKNSSFWNSSNTSDHYSQNYQQRPTYNYSNQGYNLPSNRTMRYNGYPGKVKHTSHLKVWFKYVIMMGVGLAISYYGVKYSYNNNSNNNNNSADVPATSHETYVRAADSAPRILAAVSPSDTTLPPASDENNHQSKRGFRTMSTRLHTKWTTLLVVTHAVTTQERLQDPKSPAHQAMQWLLERTESSTSTAMSSFMSLSDHDVVIQFSLATLYFATAGDKWLHQEGWLDRETDVCHWHGIQCAHTQRNAHELVETITRVTLPHNHLVGTLPEEFFAGLGRDLVTLDASQNQLQGPLPQSLLKASGSNSRALRKLYLQENAWSAEDQRTSEGLTGLKVLSIY